MPLAFPAGTVKTRRPNSTQPFGMAWTQASRWQPWWDEAAAAEGLDPQLLVAMGAIESDWQHYTTGQTTGTRAQVIAGSDRFGDGPAVGIMQVKPQLWQHVLPDADAYTPQGSIRLGARLMRLFIQETGSWQNAIRQKYHPGTSASGTTPQHYVDTVTVLMQEMGGGGPVADLPYRVSLIPAGNRNRPGTAINAGGPRYITVHETGNTNTGANAEMHRRFTHDGGGPSSVSFHLVVDDKEAIQLLPFNEIGWHASDGCDNRTTDLGCFDSIAIETCVNRDGNWEQTLRNLETLMAKMIRENPTLSVDRIRQHNTWAFDGKNCPQTIRNTGRWNEVVNQTKALLAGGGTTPPPPVPGPTLPAWLPEAAIRAAFPLYDPAGPLSKAVVAWATSTGKVPWYETMVELGNGYRLWRFKDVTFVSGDGKVWQEGKQP